MFIELHLIQSFPPSNLNRDDTGSPKECEFGGQRRARISSQSLKRAIRFEPDFARTVEVPGAIRSKWMMRPVKERLVAAGKPETTAEAVAVEYVTRYAAKADGKEKRKTSVLVYFSESEVDQMVGGLLANWDAVVAEVEGAKGRVLDDLVKELTKATKGRTSAPDIALFGRMLAEKPDLNIDAACQVSHAISTHRVMMEMDYYTAVDELLQDEEAGAGMVGFTAFNSACFYRYMRIDWKLLVRNLGGNEALAEQTVKAFLLAATEALPTGKQNAFAAQSPTNLAMAVVRGDGKSWNLANAFEIPVRASLEGGFVAPSIAALDSYWARLHDYYDDADLRVVSVHVLQHADKLEHLAPYVQPRRSSWVGTITDALSLAGEV